MKITMHKGMSAVGVIIAVVIIIILAAIVMAMNNDATDINILRNDTGADSGSNDNGAANTPNGTTAEFITYQLNEQNGSGQSGAVVISAENGRTRVAITLTGATTTASQPAHIHMNSCANIGGVVYTLNNVVNGSSVTVLDVPASQVIASPPRSINVHKSTSQPGIYVACADITTSAVR